MTIKLFEIRDRGTCCSALAIRLDGANEAERFLLARGGFGETPEAQAGYVLLLNVSGGSSGTWTCDPYEWPSRARTWPRAQLYIAEHFETLTSGDVVDVEFILGERATPKVSERVSRVS